MIVSVGSTSCICNITVILFSNRNTAETSFPLSGVSHFTETYDKNSSAKKRNNLMTNSSTILLSFFNYLMIVTRCLKQ